MVFYMEKKTNLKSSKLQHAQSIALTFSSDKKG